MGTPFFDPQLHEVYQAGSSLVKGAVCKRHMLRIGYRRALPTEAPRKGGRISLHCTGNEASTRQTPNKHPNNNWLVVFTSLGLSKSENSVFFLLVAKVWQKRCSMSKQAPETFGKAQPPTSSSSGAGLPSEVSPWGPFPWRACDVASHLQVVERHTKKSMLAGILRQNYESFGGMALKGHYHHVFFSAWF